MSDAHSVQTLATRAWRALRAYQLGKKGRPRFKPWHKGLRSMEGKAKSCLRVVVGGEKTPTCFAWTHLRIPLRLDHRDPHGYEAHALDLIAAGRWKYCRIIHRVIKGRDRLFLQVALMGPAFTKSHHKKQFARGEGRRCCFDVGPGTVAAVSVQDSDTGSPARALLTQLCGEIDLLWSQIRALQRQQARRLRLANQANYTAQIKKRGRKTITVWRMKKGARDWVRTAGWQRDQARLMDLHRIVAAKRQQSHEILANALVSMGNRVFTEQVSARGWQALWGRSIRDRAPGKLIETVSRKAEKAGGELVKIKTWQAKLSQLDHTDGSYTKKPLRQRIARLSSGEVVQRDLYSAYLGVALDAEAGRVCIATAERLWPSARLALETAMQRVINQDTKGSAMPASAGVCAYQRACRQQSVSPFKACLPVNETARGAGHSGPLF